MADQHLTDVRFDSFPLDPNLMQGVRDTGFTLCTPIQAETLPLVLSGRDVAGQAQTGTGKTAAFLIGALQHLLNNPPGPERKANEPLALMLAPTRELAVQIHKDAALLAAHLPYKLAVVFGGTGYDQQRKQLEEGVDILIGTPGRLIDYYKQGIYDLRALQVVVLDEADRMFDLGFIKDIRYFFRRMPKPEKRLGMLFSATLSYRVTELAYEHMNNPQSIKIEPDKVTVDRVTQVCYMTANDEKIPLLIGLLRDTKPPRTIIFANTKRTVERIWGYLEGNGFHPAMLSGDVPQKKRLSLLKRFQNGEVPILVATDVAARGLHIPDVTHVINFDLPDDSEDYVHRIGRTARAGASGCAISFACETHAFSLPEIETFIGHKIETSAVAAALLADIPPGSRVLVERRPRVHGRFEDQKRNSPRGPGGDSGNRNKPRRRRSTVKSS